MRRPGRVRLAIRDLSAGAAFASIALSGSVPTWATAVFALAFVLALFDVRALSRLGNWAVVLLVLAAVALFGAALRGVLDLVVAACTFAALLSAHRLLAKPTAATDNQVHLSNLLMIAGGAALSGELFFGGCLAVYTLSASLALGLGVLEEATPEGEAAPLRQAAPKLALGAVAALAGGIAFFVLFPRLSWNFAARRTNPALAAPVAGFSDRVRLGGGGTLKNNPRVVLRATLRPDPGKEQLDAYWIGRTFDTFTGREWTGTGVEEPPQASVTLSPSTPRLTYQQIELLPAYGARTLVALEPPLLLGNAIAHGPGGSLRVGLVHVRGEEVHFAQPGVSFSYHAYSAAQPDAPTTLSEGADLSRYLGLPSNLDPRVAELADRVIGPEKDPLRAARRVESYLRQGYAYTLELPGDDGDPLADFLFERRAGHCEHFATALAVLLRARGFPARVAGGFFGGQRSGGSYIVRGGDAHAWAQVWVPGQGFLSIDATPDDSRAGAPAPFLAWLTASYEHLEELWRQRVVDYSFEDQRTMVRALVRPPDERAAPRLALPSSRTLWLSAAVLVLLWYGAWRLRSLWRGRRPAARATSFLDALERAIARAGVAQGAGEGIEELACRLEQERHPLARPVRPAVRRYLEARFGGRPLAPGEAGVLLGAICRPPGQRGMQEP